MLLVVDGRRRDLEHAKASAVTYLQNYEQFGNRDVPFFGDYNYVDVAGTKVLMNWTDSRDTVRRHRPALRRSGRRAGRWHGRLRRPPVPRRSTLAGVWSADNCPNAGGLNQNIFGLVLG